MELINRHVLGARKVARWVSMYDSADVITDNMTEVYQALLDLGHNPDPDQVVNLLGTTRSEVPPCAECKKDKYEVVEILEGTRTVCLCAECLLKAMMLINP